MLNIKQNDLFWNVPQVSQFFYLLRDLAQKILLEMKILQNSRFSSKIQECSKNFFLDDQSFFLEKSYDKSN